MKTYVNFSIQEQLYCKMPSSKWDWVLRVGRGPQMETHSRHRALTVEDKPIFPCCGVLGSEEGAGQGRNEGVLGSPCPALSQKEVSEEGQGKVEVWILT